MKKKLLKEMSFKNVFLIFFLLSYKRKLFFGTEKSVWADPHSCIGIPLFDLFFFFLSFIKVTDPSIEAIVEKWIAETTTLATLMAAFFQARSCWLRNLRRRRFLYTLLGPLQWLDVAKREKNDGMQFPGFIALSFSAICERLFQCAQLHKSVFLT